MGGEQYIVVFNPLREECYSIESYIQDTVPFNPANAVLATNYNGRFLISESGTGKVFEYRNGKIKHLASLPVKSLELFDYGNIHVKNDSTITVFFKTDRDTLSANMLCDIDLEGNIKKRYRQFKSSYKSGGLTPTLGTDDYLHIISCSEKKGVIDSITYSLSNESSLTLSVDGNSGLFEKVYT